MAEERLVRGSPVGLLYEDIKGGRDPTAFRKLQETTVFDYDKQLIFAVHQLNDDESWLCLYCGSWGGTLERSCPWEVNGRGFDLCSSCPFSTSWPWSQESFRRRLAEYHASVGRPVYNPPAERRDMTWFTDL